MKPPLPLLLGLVLLGAAWAGPLPRLAAGSFVAHMALHLAVVALAAPLLARGLLAARLLRAAPWAAAPLLASALELLVIWAWHAPALHRLARTQAPYFALEQLCFLLAGLALWLSAFAGLRERRASGAGIAGLLMTAMHMALLGALLALAPRPLYALGCASGGFGLSALQDQQAGGVLMLLVGGSSYVAGALYLLARLLQPRGAAAVPR